MFLAFVRQYPFILAFIFGLIPALIWLWFWLKEDVHPEPAKMITLSFLGGMLSVLLALPLQRIIYDHLAEYQTISFFIFATIEEISKFFLVYIIALRNKKITDEPVDDIIYLIVAALGFVTFENTLFLIEPLSLGKITDTIITGNLRFMGASLIHIISSATIGIFMGFSFFGTKLKKISYFIIGLTFAIILHTSFNLIIINKPESYLFYTFGAVWFGIVIILLIFEKIKTFGKNDAVIYSETESRPN